MRLCVGIKSHNTKDKSSEKNLPVWNVPNLNIYHICMHGYMYGKL